VALYLVRTGLWAIVSCFFVGRLSFCEFCERLVAFGLRKSCGRNRDKPVRFGFLPIENLEFDGRNKQH
jgi:hypothetical protein